MIFEITYRIIHEFVSVTVTVIPYFILGTVLGALLDSCVKPSFAFRYLNKGISSVINAALLGAALPGCACATMPMADSLRRKGAGLGTVSAFIVVSPLLSPHTLILTYGMLGLKFAAARVVFSLSGAILLGLLLNDLEERKVRGFGFPSSAQTRCFPCSEDIEARRMGFWKNFLGVFANITMDLGKYFLLGMLIASLLTVFIPAGAIPRYIGSSGAFAYIAAALVGIPLYVCEGEEIPLTLALLKLGLGAGPSLTFLLGAVGTCVPTMMMAPKIIGKGATILYVTGWFGFAIVSGWLFGLWV